jgi:hypothetical protein
MRWMAAAALAPALAACASGPKLPAPNTAQARFDSQQGVVQVMISDLAPATAAELLGSDGARYQATAVTLLRGPYIAYNPPPSVGLGIGGWLLSATGVVEVSPDQGGD